MHIDINGPIGARIFKNIWNITFLAQKNHFEVVFDQLCINPYSIDWFEVMDKKICLSHLILCPSHFSFLFKLVFFLIQFTFFFLRGFGEYLHS